MRQNNFWCEHPQTRLVYKTFSNGTNHYYRQCIVCFKQTTDWLGRKNLGNEVMSAIHEDQDGNGLTYPKTEREWKEYGKWLHQRGMDRYDIYLKSPEWQAKREIVMKRDHRTCQSRLRGCNGKATEVHHLTYANVPNEGPEDLIAICHHCHEVITKESKTQWVTM